MRGLTAADEVRGVSIGVREEAVSREVRTEGWNCPGTSPQRSRGQPGAPSSSPAGPGAPCPGGPAGAACWGLIFSSEVPRNRPRAGYNARALPAPQVADATASSDACVFSAGRAKSASKRKGKGPVGPSDRELNETRGLDKVRITVNHRNVKNVCPIGIFSEAEWVIAEKNQR